MKTSFLIIIGLTILAVASAAKPTKDTKSESASAEKAAKEDTVISENLDDISKEEKDVEDEVRIPRFDELTTQSDPIALGQRIKSLTDKKKKNKLIAKLKKAENKYKGTYSGKFYKAAYASLSKKEGAVEKAKKFWEKELRKALAEFESYAAEAVDQAKASVGDAVDNTVKNLGKAADLAYDAIKTVPVPVV